jgi:hypothetical protein
MAAGVDSVAADVTRPRPTLRARLTLLYTGLFTVCGTIVVAVSYTLVAQLGVPGRLVSLLPPSRRGAGPSPCSPIPTRPSLPSATRTTSFWARYTSVTSPCRTC